jgi:hypothetical protein
MIRSTIRFLSLFAVVVCHPMRIANSQQESDSAIQMRTGSSTAETWPVLPLGLNPTFVIDLALQLGYKNHSIQPVQSVNDSTFTRRVYLDLLGRPPRQTERDNFLSTTNSTKREDLINQLLSSNEHAVHLAEVLDAILIGRTNVDQVQKRSTAGWLSYLENAIHDNRPWNQVAREMVLARPSSAESRGAAWYLYARKNKHQDIAEAVSKDLFGVRIDCAQCHDHPLADEIKQKHYWGLVAFFNRSKNIDTAQGPRISESAIGGFSDFANLEGSSSPNELRFLEDRFIEEVRPAKDVKEVDSEELYISAVGTDPKVPKFSRREQFVEKVLADHPLVAKAMVNRMWGWMMGRGLVHPVDALDSYHPASHPELLEWLSRDFAASGYDVRRLIKAIACTRAYQLESSNSSNVDPKWFASALPKPLTAEMLQRSMVLVLDPVDADRWKTLDKRVVFTNLFPDVLTEESIANVAQGMMLTNSESMAELVSVKHSRFLQDLKTEKENPSAIDQLFLGILGRKPESDEMEYCSIYLDARADHDRAVEGLAWALITSAEFRFNH